MKSSIKFLFFLLMVCFFVLESCGTVDMDASNSSSGGNGEPGISSGSNSNQIYDTVVIGTQTWMAENLNYNVNGSRCYDNDPANCTKYGRLYDWAAAMDLPRSCNNESCSSQMQLKHKGVCPSGWHIPNNDDWNVLINYVGGSSSAGSELKAKNGWYNCGTFGSASSNLCEDTYDFTALPGGYGSSGNFYNVGTYGNWWTASEYGVSNAYFKYMHYNSENVYGTITGKSSFRSVRCIKDE